MAAAPLTPLPDLLREGLRLVFVGINPGVKSAQVGHYFAAPSNRFWAATNAAGIFSPHLGPGSDQHALDQGIGFTDIVKRPSTRASDVRLGEFREGAGALKERLLAVRPAGICFNGMTAFRHYMKYGQGIVGTFDFGAQLTRLGDTAVFVVPSPSGANAAFSLADLVRWYRVVAEWLHEGS